MESINIELKSNKKRLCINGDENKVIEFNPEDMNTRRKFYNASQKIFEKQREFDIKVKALKEGDIESAFKLEEEAFTMMKEIIDDVFGSETTMKITDGDMDIFALCNFVVAIAPYFKEVTEKQKNKYVDGLKDAGVI